MTYLLGVDAGQSVTKAVLFDSRGRVVALGRADNAVDSPHPRWQERDMDALWRQTASAVGVCLREAGVPGQSIAAVGLCGHNDGVYPVDRAGRPIRPAILATDSRAHAYVARYRRDGTAERALTLTGQSPFAGSPAALYAWLRDHEPATLERARWLLFCKDWLRLRMTGEVVTDLTEASASFTDVHTQAYSRDALRLYDLEPCAPLLPPVRRSDEVVGYVGVEAAVATGLAPGTPVVAGAHDVDAAALGMGAAEPGDASMMMGTFAINQVVADEVRVDHRWQARNYLSPGRWLHMSTSPGSAANLTWTVRLLGPHDETGAPDHAAAVEAGLSVPAEEAPLFLPFLFGSPHGESLAASLADVRGWHRREHLLRAVLDGVAFNHRTHLDALRERFIVTGPIRLGGGGAASPGWAQLLADTCSVPMEVTGTAESGALGAALLAGVGIGVFGSLADAVRRAVRVAHRHDPDPDAAGRQAERYLRYRALVESLGAGAPDMVTPPSPRVPVEARTGRVNQG